MIYCIALREFERFLTKRDFVIVAETDTTFVFVRTRDDAVLTVRRPNDNGDMTQAAALAACDAAEIEPAAFSVHRCD